MTWRHGFATLVAVCLCLPAAMPAVPATEGEPETDGEAAGEEARAEEPLDVGAEERLRVVASPIIEGNTVDRYGNQTTTVTQQQILDLDAHDPQSALRRTPGVVISRHNMVGSFGGGEGGAVYIRGKGSSRPGAEIQTLVDGVPIFVSIWTHPLMDVLSIDLADRIEVHKGAQAVFLGNMAFGAVNFVPKQRCDEGSGGRVTLGGGSYSTGFGIAEYGGRHERLDYYVVGSYRGSDGHREDADGELGAFSGRFGYRLSKSWESSLFLSRTDNEAGDPGPADGSAPADGTFKVDDWLGILTLSNDFGKSRGNVKLYWNRGDIDWIDQFDDATQLNDADTLTDYTNFGIRARQSIDVWRGGEVVAGIDWDNIRGEVEFRSGGATTSIFEETTFRLLAPYVALSHRFDVGAGWELIPSAGVRLQAHDTFDDETGWQAAVVAEREATRFHLSASRSSNYPGIYVVVQDDQFLPGDNRWQDLDPEIVEHVEAGAARRFGKFSADLTLFRDGVEDRIVVVPPPPFPPVFGNVESYTLEGVEATATWSPLGSVAVFAGMTWLDADRDVPYAPEWTASAGINLRAAARVPVSLDAQYVDDQLVGSWGRSLGFTGFQPVDGYVLVNGRVAWDFEGPGASTSQVYLAFENLFDEDYELRKGYPMPGATVRAGVTLSF